VSDVSSVKELSKRWFPEKALPSGNMIRLIGSSLSFSRFAGKMTHADRGTDLQSTV
ncbi:hypothetical protein U1Q18_052287, partial [Sarracenia purpurea var. burkii]